MGDADSSSSSGSSADARVSEMNFEREGMKLLAQIQETVSTSIASRYMPLNLIFEDKRTHGRVYCGNIGASKNRKLLEEHGICNIVNCQGKSTSNTFEADPAFHYKRFQIEKWQTIVAQRKCSVWDFALPTLQFIDAAVARGEGVLIHCLAGAHRAGTTTVAYLMHKVGTSAKEAIALAKQLRPAINPIGRLFEFLRVFEKECPSGGKVLASTSGATATSSEAPVAANVAEQIDYRPSNDTIGAAGGGAGSKAHTGPNYRFDPDDESAWLDHLKSQGFVVLAGALQPSEVDNARRLLWNDIVQQWPGLRPTEHAFQPTDNSNAEECAGGSAALGEGTQPETRISWNDVQRFPAHGLVPQLCQSAGAWEVRGAPTVRRAFAAIWGCADTDLITSMDCVILWRPWGRDPFQATKERGRGATAAPPRPRTEGMHLDQNPFSKPHLETVQGMVPLRPVTHGTGGLAVLPGSHTATSQAALRKRNPHLEHCGDFCMVRLPPRPKPVLVLAGPGDLILWDSRTVHGGMVGEGCRASAMQNQLPVPQRQDRAERVFDDLAMVPESMVADSTCELAAAAVEKNTATPVAIQTTAEHWKEWKSDFARMSVTVAMTKRSRASPETLRIRRAGFEAGMSFNHTPHEAGTSTGTLRCRTRAGYKPCKLSAIQQLLLDGTVSSEQPSSSEQAKADSN